MSLVFPCPNVLLLNYEGITYYPNITDRPNGYVVFAKAAREKQKSKAETVNSLKMMNAT